MSNEYYQAGSTPGQNSPGASATMRAQFALIAAAFDKLPIMAGSEGEFVLINPSGTALVASGYAFADFVTVTGVQTVTNKTLAWADNTWPGFGTGATKDAGTAADNVLLLAESNKLPALDGSLLTALPDDANLGGSPTATTPGQGDTSARIATTQFVAQAVIDVGGAVPSNATPLMNGAPSPGAAILVSRDDHVHPSDTSRAPASAETAAGTSFSPAGSIVATDVQAAIQELDAALGDIGASDVSFSPAGSIVATDVQAAIQELDSEKAPLSAGTAAGTSYIAGGGIIATNVQAAIQELDSEKAPVASPTFTGTITHSGDVVLSGSGKRITGDFSNATLVNRLMFQTSTVNGNTVVQALPSGSGSGSFFSTLNNSDTNNFSRLVMGVNQVSAAIESQAQGTGSLLPITFWTNNVERVRIGINGQIGLSGGNYGAAGQALVSNGPSAAPTWQYVANGYSCRAWVNFNGTGTVAIRASGNVSSITDNGTGDYTVNFTAAMPDANYAVVSAHGSSTQTVSYGSETISPRTYSTGSVRVVHNRTDGALVDSEYVNLAVFR